MQPALPLRQETAAANEISRAAMSTVIDSPTTMRPHERNPTNLG